MVSFVLLKLLLILVNITTSRLHRLFFRNQIHPSTCCEINYFVRDLQRSLPLSSLQTKNVCNMFRLLGHLLFWKVVSIIICVPHVCHFSHQHHWNCLPICLPFFLSFEGGKNEKSQRAGKQLPANLLPAHGSLLFEWRRKDSRGRKDATLEASSNLLHTSNVPPDSSNHVKFQSGSMRALEKRLSTA